MTDHAEMLLAGSVGELKQYNLTEISVAIGVFDGVHAGHRKLLRELMTLAAETATAPVAVTFFPHPRQILFPGDAPELLIPREEKYRRLFACGVRAVVEVPFDKALAALPPEDFIRNCLNADGVRLRGICVGSEWRFGAGGKGDSSLLATLSERTGFLFRAVPELRIDGETVSSSAIRKAVTSGDIEKANRYLSSPYEIFGKVVRGEGVAGGTLDHPTANVEPFSRILPPAGVYAARARIGGSDGRLPAVMNIGAAPTFDSYGKKDLLRVEVHLLSGGGDLYGKEIAVEPAAFLRKEERFPDAEALKDQIGRDIASAQRVLQTPAEPEEKGKTMAESAKYTVIELSEQLGVKRTTVNDWLTKYAVYIEYAVQGKRRIYSGSALAVLKKVAELRAKGLSSFEIDAELAKVCAVHPQPEPDAPESPAPALEPEGAAGRARTETARTDGAEAAALAARRDAGELLLRFQAMMDKIDRLEAMTKALPASAPEKPESAPVPARGGARNALLWTLFGFIVVLFAAAGWQMRTDMAKLESRTERQSEEIGKQLKINENLRQDVFVLDNTRRDFEDNVKRLEAEIAKEREARSRQAAAAEKMLSETKAGMEKQRKSDAEQHQTELQLQRERFEKERLDMVRKFEKQVLEAEKKALELEKREAERKAAEAAEKARAAEAGKKPEAKSEPKPAAQSAQKPEAKSEPKPAVQSAQKPEAKPAPQPVQTPSPSGNLPK